MGPSLAARGGGTVRVWVLLALRIRLPGVIEQRTVFLELIVDPFTGIEVREGGRGVSVVSEQTCRGSWVRHGRRTMVELLAIGMVLGG